MIQSLLNSDFIYAPIVAFLIFGSAYSVRIIRELSSIDMKKSKREHSLYQLELLKALRGSSGSVVTLLPAKQDTPDIKVIKEEFWGPHSISITHLKSLEKRYEKRTLMPILALKSYAKGKDALVFDDNKETEVKYSRHSNIFLTFTTISYFLFLAMIVVISLIAVGTGTQLSENILKSTLELVLSLLLLSSLVSYITFGKFKKNLNASRFLNLIKSTNELPDRK